MSNSTFYSSLDKLTISEKSKILKEEPKIKIPDVFTRTLSKNKSTLLKEQYNKHHVRELFFKRQFTKKNYFDSNIHNFCLAGHKYRSLEKNNFNSENCKLYSPLPNLFQRISILNFRYQEDPRNYEKYKNLGKELIHIQKYSNIKTETVIPNKNVNKFYFINKKKKINSIDNIHNSNNCEKKIKEFDNKLKGNIHCQNMTFASPFPISMGSRNIRKNYNYIFDEALLNELMTNFYLRNFKRYHKQSNNTLSSKNIIVNINDEEKGDSTKNKNNKINFNNINGNYNTINHNLSNNCEELLYESSYCNNKIDKSKEKTDNNTINNETIEVNKEKNDYTINNETFKINKEKNNKQKNNETNKINKEKYYGNYTINIESVKIKRENKSTSNNKKITSVIENANNFLNDNNDIKETPKRRFYFKKNFKNYEINLKPLKIFNSFSSSTMNKISKIKLQTKIIPIALLPQFKNKYITQEEFQKMISKQLIHFPLNINISSNNSKDIFYYFINKMYRNQLVEYMKHRTNWELITKANNDGLKTINFEWKYMSNRLNFKNFKYDPSKPSKKLRMVNLFERNYEVGNKKSMFINLINYCDIINVNVFSLVPFTIIINNTKDVDYSLESIKDIVDFVNKNKNIKRDLISNRKYNEHFWFDKNFENLRKQYIYINNNFLSDKNYWILKPTDLYQGKCIEICNSFEEISKKCRNIFKGVEKKFIPEEVKEEELSEDENNQNINISKLTININDENNNATNINSMNINNLNNNTNEPKNTTNSNNNNVCNSCKKKIAYSRMYCSNEIIIQKYLDKPLLYYKRKFDIRCFVLVDSNLNIFFCKEGHLKGSSELYDLNNTNKLIHITNYSLQKKSSKFEIYEDGNEISYNDFKKYMKEKNIPIENFNNMINQMKYLVEISFKSVGKKLIKTSPVLCFEIFGYDFIIDNDFKPWILEINNNPGLCISSPVIKKLVPRMLDDAFRLTIDKIFETRYSPEVIDSDGNYKSKYQLDGFSDEENVFEFLCNLN